MHIVHINDAPSVRDQDGILRRQCTDLHKIVAAIDPADGRNDALVHYIFALRDLQHAHETGCLEEDDAAIEAAEAAVTQASDELVAAQNRLLPSRSK
jgi:hypothetical protein